jgi:hypothetical protein
MTRIQTQKATPVTVKATSENQSSHWWVADDSHMTRTLNDSVAALHVGFVVDRVALPQDFLQILRFSHYYPSTSALYSYFIHPLPTLCNHRK